MLCDNAFYLVYYGNKDGERIMSTVIREICVLSILCGVVCSITPEGMVKRVTGILCSCVLIITVISPLRDFDFDYYAELLSSYREREASITRRGDEITDRLNRTVIQGECETYISDEGEKLGIGITEVSVELQWSTEAVWTPHSAVIHAKAGTSARKKLEALLASELGIPAERVEWIDVG